MAREGILLYISIVLTAVLLSTGCSQDPIETPVPGGKPGKTVIVPLQLRLPKAANPTPVPEFASALVAANRAANAQQPFHMEFEEPQQGPQTRSDGTTKLYNLWLFQFNADGSINGMPQKVSDATTAINDMVLIDVPLVVAKNQTLYLLAMGRQLDENLGTIRTFNDLQNFSFNYTSSKGGIARSKITSEDDMPFAGYIMGATVVETSTGENRGQIEYNSPDGFTGGIDVRRLMSKVTLRYKFEVPGYELEGLRLLNATATVRITNPEKNDPADSYITLEGETSKRIDEDGFYSVTWFMAQNQQGNVNEILTENDRYYYTEGATSFGKAPVKGTHIEAWAYSTTAPDFYAIYQMYLGKNNSSNFDVTSNTYYNIRTTINTDLESAKNDGRVRPYNAVLTTSLRASGSQKKDDENTDDISGIVGGVSFDLDAHYDTRQIDIFTKGRIVSIGIYTDSQCLNLADPSTSWLKLSSSKNYTEAINNIAEPLSTSIATDLIQLPTKLTFYLYNEEYLVDPEGNYFDYTRANSKRRLYIWVKTATEGVTNIKRYSMIYWFDQRPAVYAGRMGGKLENMQYQTGLCSEQLMESDLQYTPEAITTSSVRPIGYLADNLEGRDNYSGVRDAWNGRLATMQMVYNPDKLLVNKTGSVTANYNNPVMRSDGHPMLYQYGKHNSYAARYCYDKNRDNNGNGYLDEEEVVWYMPAIYQAYGTKLWMYDNYASLKSMFTSTIIKKNAAYVELYPSDTQHYSQNKSVRCVRDFEPANRSKERMYIHTDERGNRYGAIDASELPRTENRNQDATSNIYVTLPLYTYTVDGNGSVPIVDGENKQIYVQRLRRHVVSASIDGIESVNQHVSKHFLIASTHINGAGEPVDADDYFMPWADAMGYLATANTVSAADGVKPGGSAAVSRGCPMYCGKDGRDPIGSWRVPTVREMMLLAVYFGEYNKICATMDSQPFLLPIEGGGTSERHMYWMATEETAEKAWSMRLFYDLNSLPMTSGIYTGTNKMADNKEPDHYKPHLVRCIRDLPSL